MSFQKLMIKQIKKESVKIKKIQSNYSGRTFQLISLVGSALGTHYAFVLLFPLLLWFGEDSFVGIITTTTWTTCIVNIFKDLFQLPRPFVAKNDLVESVLEEFGLPSTHTANATAIAISVSCLVQGRFVYTLFVRLLLFFYVFLTGFSRLIYGVHSFIDLYSGAFVGTFPK